MGKKDGFTPAQRFFISFGQIWCGNSTEQSARMLAKTDPHSSGEWRVKGTVQNFEEFGKAFGCKVGQPMMPVKPAASGKEGLSITKRPGHKLGPFLLP